MCLRPTHCSVPERPRRKETESTCQCHSDLSRPIILTLISANWILLSTQWLKWYLEKSLILSVVMFISIIKYVSGEIP